MKKYNNISIININHLVIVIAFVFLMGCDELEEEKSVFEGVVVSRVFLHNFDAITYFPITREIIEEGCLVTYEVYDNDTEWISIDSIIKKSESADSIDEMNIRMKIDQGGVHYYFDNNGGLSYENITRKISKTEFEKMKKKINHFVPVKYRRCGVDKKVDY